ncbi:MAG: methyltransferase domain-containing protein [Fusobacterium perfoetens]|uniref:methyltransferase domain-containing protein n=1 Tax=Fusobacterium perfoetens TaxID=852 RepID=UPI0023F09C71|nr:methyltransferase domain-containing protein [Fusobacterium perfoetens]MCI6152505.1 methyltransferase domain-containing protein [Fusobacterium perfoetens]MDY3237513.1 methyltransferase domain-containing protein [Fusobacterium perfoetens]
MNFEKNFSTYDSNAIIQKEVAKKLVKIIEENINEKKFNRVFELGCGTGLFTKEVLKKFQIKNLDLNDYYDTKSYFKDIDYNNFIVGDMVNSINEDYDIIISSSSFQWIDDLEKLIENISNKTDKLFFSMYIDGNLEEIQKHFGVGLNYKTLEEITKILKKYFNEIKYFNEKKTLEFFTPLEALKHIKNTGVSLKNTKTSIEKIKSYKTRELTYSIGYFIAKK